MRKRDKTRQRTGLKLKILMPIIYNQIHIEIIRKSCREFIGQLLKNYQSTLVSHLQIHPHY